MTTAPSALSSYFTIRKAAEYVGVSPKTLRAWDRAGKLPARRHPVNGYRLYDRARLDDLLRSVANGADR
jgi:excisionase family DNA binding protein